MQPEVLDTFLDLCETRSFNRSADRLRVTQSTVSSRIAGLEKTLGVQLFHRSRGGCDITTEGLRFEPHARALRAALTEARAAARGASGRAITLRLGLQADLAANDPVRWVTWLRGLLPEAAIYIEAAFSASMCRDVQRGDLDLSLIFTPDPTPDIHFETVGERRYQMIAPVGEGLGTLESVTPERYVLASLAPAFTRTHGALLPHLSTPPLSAGQSDTVRGMMFGFKLAGYLDSVQAQDLIARGLAEPVQGAPVIPQPVYAAIHYRNRHRAMWRKIIAALRDSLGDPT
ncbi:MAG: LysR family transcriptional regulator [Paracoccaceae bacterium]